MKMLNNFLAGMMGTLVVACWACTGIFITIGCTLASCKWVLTMMGVL